MDGINTEYLEKCIRTLELSYRSLQTAEENSIEYELYRNSLVKGFEMTMEQCGTLLKKKLAPYFSSKRELDKLRYKDLYRHALKHSLLESPEVERWLEYRDNRNATAHDYGQKLAEETLTLMDLFIKDAYRLKEMIDHG
ncbi:nucleotidyltransferase substrate binding protein [Candidatus Haliotispira prima]|uniref:Nucleotidyltransferase substrate binding protein n=1 Tax=Candidatus Haliotispira prima TaxID=3034016 RepID=A0ABY8MKG6_9SPIO|nr:nucleotidyltransferase substrate binding protein [Candidatus Haliotispira prima]